jgi:signal transduction histidine kinase
MLEDFLRKNLNEILAMTEKKSVDLAGAGPSSALLVKGLPIFYDQLMIVLKRQQAVTPDSEMDKDGMAKAAHASNEEGLAEASGRPEDALLAKEAGLHGIELWRLGYTLSHVVHAYGAMCQSITELADQKKFPISVNEFRDLNRCLDVAIAGAVTAFQLQSNSRKKSLEAEHLGSLAHEMRNALSSAKIALQLIKRGTVGLEGNTGKVLENSLNRLDALIERSLTEVRLREDPKIEPEPVHLLQIVDQIILTAGVEAGRRKQTFHVQIPSDLVLVADQHLLYSALSNVIQNALKFTHTGGEIKIRGNPVGENIVIEVEDECGGLNDAKADLFKPFVQKNDDRGGMGLGLTITKQAVTLNKGTIEVRDLPGKGCIFALTLPRKADMAELAAKPTS